MTLNRGGNMSPRFLVHPRTVDDPAAVDGRTKSRKDGEAYTIVVYDWQVRLIAFYRLSIHLGVETAPILPKLLGNDVATLPQQDGIAARESE